MKKHIGIVVLALLIVGSLVTYTVAYQVDELKDIVVIETWGKVTHAYIGSEPGQCVLKIKWPYPVQKVIRYDSRPLVFEDTTEEGQTKDKQNLLVTVYCTWKITNPKTFHAVTREDDPQEKVRLVQESLRKMVRHAKSNVVSSHNMDRFINTNPKEMELADIEQEIHDQLKGKKVQDYGVEIIRVGIKSLGLTERVTGAVIDAMKQERQEDVKRFETEGKAQAQAIVSEAEKARALILAFAARKAMLIKTEGDEAAARYYVKFREDPQFGIFLRRLESLKKALSENAVMVLNNTDLKAIGWFHKEPSLKPKAEKK